MLAALSPQAELTREDYRNYRLETDGTLPFETWKQKHKLLIELLKRPLSDSGANKRIKTLSLELGV